MTKVFIGWSESDTTVSCESTGDCRRASWSSCCGGCGDGECGNGGKSAGDFGGELCGGESNGGWGDGESWLGSMIWCEKWVIGGWEELGKTKEDINSVADI
jgi:hypothetical protein